MRSLTLRVLLWLERWGLWALVAATVVLFGCVVMSRFLQGGGFWQSLLNVLTQDADSRDILDQAAHSFLLLTGAWAAIGVYLKAFGLKLDSWTARSFCANHLIIVAGNGRAALGPDPAGGAASSRAASLAVEFARARAKVDRGKVVLCLPGVDEDTRRQLWHGGVLLIQDNLPSPGILRCAGAHRARMVVAMREDPRENVILARAALSEQAVREDLKCVVMNGHPSRGNRLEVFDYFDPNEHARIREFNDAELIASNLMSKHPPHAKAVAAGERVHLMLVGLGSIGQSVLLRMARQGHYPWGLRTRVTVIDRNVKAKLAEIERDHRHIQKILELVPGELGTTGLPEDLVGRLKKEAGTPHLAYVCTRDELFNLQVVRWLRAKGSEDQESFGADIVVLDPPGGCVLKNLQDEPGSRTMTFSLAEQAETLLADPDDRLPRAIHRAYRKLENERLALRGEGPEKLVKNWDEIPEGDRASNRQAAEHFETKLACAGWKRVDAADPTPAMSLELQAGMPGQVFRLATSEHARWMAERTLAGAMLGSKVKRQAPLDRLTFVPMAYLTDEEANKDGQQIAETLKFLLEEGQKIVSAGVEVFRGHDIQGGDLRFLAEALLQAHAPDARRAHGRRLHLLLHGSGRLAQEMLLLWAASGLGRDAQRPRVTWVAQGGAERWKDLAAIEPGLARWMEVTPVEPSFQGTGETAARVADPVGALLDDSHVDGIFFCPDPGERLPGIVDTLAGCLQAAANAGTDTALDVVAIAWEAPPVCGVREGHLGRARLHWVDAADLLCRRREPKRVGAEAPGAQELARGLHERYCTRGGGGPRWDSLPEFKRQSNIASALHLPVKLKAVGRRLAKAGTAAEAPLDAEEAELLARMEHDRWWAERECSGWTLGSPKDEALKRHPDLRPYELLDEACRQLDRDKVGDILALLRGRAWVLARD